MLPEIRSLNPANSVEGAIYEANRWSVPLEQQIETTAYDLTAARSCFKWSPGGTRIAYLAPGNPPQTGNFHIRKTPKELVPSTGPECTADRAMPSTVRVSRGSTNPSSQMREVAK